MNSEQSVLQTATVLDTAVTSTNLGDQIIMEAVRRELADVLSGRMVFTVASHEWMGGLSRSLIRGSSHTIAGGTNLLSSHMWFRMNWKVTPADGLRGMKVILMGVGWYQYQGNPDPYSRWIIRRLLSSKGIHSVREGYAAKMLETIGIRNVVNTGCPTIWSLTPEHCARLPRRKSRSVLTALNSYKNLNNPEADRRMLQTLRKHYDTVYLWIQTHTDRDYAHALDDRLQFVDPSLSALDRILTSDMDLDYVGNRLHAGIRALQKGRRSIILEIDNRAREMGNDFSLPTVERCDFDRIEKMINEPSPIAVTLPAREIAAWKNQFSNSKD
jgi:polysaccharide pyruvyl transferase WcaK-like protein